MNYPKGASVLIIKDDKVLAVRRGQKDRWGLPGGRLEESESTLDAAVRECMEETGLVLDSATGHFIYGGVCEADHLSGKEYWVDTYMFKLPGTQTPCTMEPDNKVEWMNIQDFLQKSSFAKYHSKIFSAICNMFPDLNTGKILHICPELD